MPEPLVSIVMTNYNNEKYTGRAVQSILDQTYRNCEMIVVDDASTDHSVEILRSFSDKRIKLLVNETNSQVSFARNRGYENAKGEYIATIDSDDMWMPEKLARQVSFMEGHPDIGACFTWIQLIDGDDRQFKDDALEKIYNIGNKKREEWLHDLLLNGNCLADDSSLMRREARLEVGENDISLVQLQDYDMWLRTLSRFDIYVLEEPLLKYRKTDSGNSISAPGRSTSHRLYFESGWIVGKTLMGMDDTLFREVFKDELTAPEDTSSEAAKCEKALLLASGRFPGPGAKAYAFMMLSELLANAKTAELLRNRFDYGQKKLYQMTGSPIFYDPSVEYEMNRREIRIKQLEDQITMVNNSRWWKLGAPIRKLKKRRDDQQTSEALTPDNRRSIDGRN